MLIAPCMGGRSRPARILLFACGVAALVFLQVHNPRVVRSLAIWLLGLAVRFCPAPLTRSATLAWVLAAVGMVACPLLSPRLGIADTLLVALPFANLLPTLQHEASPVPLPGARLYTALAGFSFSLYFVHAPAMHFALTLANGTADPALHLQPVGWVPLASGIALFLGLALYACLFSRLTEAHTDQVHAFLSRSFSSAFVRSR